MTLKECYDAMGGDYEDVTSRLMSERIVRKFVLKFPADTTFHDLCRSMEEKQYADAFRAAHTLKGVCQNLGMKKLYVSSSYMTEALRNGKYDDAVAMLATLSSDYAMTIAAIGKLDS